MVSACWSESGTLCHGRCPALQQSRNVSMSVPWPLGTTGVFCEFGLKKLGSTLEAACNKDDGGSNATRMPPVSAL